MLIGNLKKFTIDSYHKKQARKLGVNINYSSNPDKKLDVFKDGKKVASIGASGYNDYILYKKAEAKGIYPKGYAEKRRRLYKIRHRKNNIKGTAGYYAYNILW